MNELIKKLKKNNRAFGLCSTEEQECFKEASIDKCIFLNSTNEWVNPIAFIPNLTYRIKADYQPEQEKEDSKPEWWPDNPYPETIFPTPRERYAEVVPDPGIRTALSGRSSLG